MSKLESQWNCPIDRNFTDSSQMVRAFLYQDYSIEPHTHDFYEINIILSGSGTHLIEDRSYSAEAGDVFVIPPNIIHSYVDTHTMDAFHILVRPIFLQEQMQEHQSVKGFQLLMDIEPFLRKKYNHQFFLRLSPMELEDLQQDLDLIKDGGLCTSEDCEPLKNHTAMKILYWMSLLLHRQTYLPHKNIEESARSIIAVLEYIHANYGHKITVDLLCKEASMSRPTLMRKFRTICGCSPMQYVAHYRKQKALSMLQNSRLNKTQIAYECGFYDLSHMERVLKVGFH